MTNQKWFGYLILGTTLCGVGLVTGWFANKILSEPDIVTLNSQVEPTGEMPTFSEEELSHLCAGTVQEHKTGILDLQKKVTGLQSTLEEKEKELDALQAKQEKGAGVSKRQKELESELATLRIQLAATEQERDSLRSELKQTLGKLDRQIRETKKYKAKAKKYKRQSVENLWKAFVADAKVQGCDRGSRKRHEKCWAAFNGVLTEGSNHHQRFMTCVNTQQAVPVLRKAKMFEKLPSFATWLSGDKNTGKFIKGWYILFCDPSLPTNPDEKEIDGTESTPKKTEWSDLDLDSP